jgi:hypothetical protein
MFNLTISPLYALHAIVKITLSFAYLYMYSNLPVHNLRANTNKHINLSVIF